ncbi:MAG TPA: IS110 family transposase [Candidatus Marinimicrobia bacterium]|nr:IS110 family transposase [Candidatus Neomarinimicrobiota bacterium]
MKYIGLDVHSSHINCAVIDEQGNLIHHDCFNTSLENLINLSENLKHPLSLVYEEGELADWLFQGLRSSFEEIVVADPIENRMIYGGDQKSDPIDPLKLATLLRGGFINPVHHTWDHHRSQFKQLVFAYHDMAKQVTRTKNKIKAYFRKQGMIIKTDSVYHPDKRALFINESRHPEIIEKYYQFLDLFQNEKNRFERTLKKEARRYPIIGRFLKIPGAGIVTTTTFFTIVDDPHRFDHKQQLWSYAHLGKSVHQSGNYEVTRRQRKGNRLLKYVIKIAAGDAVRQKTNEFTKAYIHMVNIQHKEPKLAYRIIARKLLTIMWTIWKNNQSYKPREKDTLNKDMAYDLS